MLIVWTVNYGGCVRCGGWRVVLVIRVVVVVCVALCESYALLLGLMDFGFCD